MHLVLKHPKIILSSIKCQNTLRVHFLSKSQAISKFVVKDALRSSNFKNPKIFLLKFQIIEMFWKTTQPTKELVKRSICFSTKICTENRCYLAGAQYIKWWKNKWLRFTVPLIGRFMDTSLNHNCIQRNSKDTIFSEGK